MTTHSRPRLSLACGLLLFAATHAIGATGPLRVLVTNDDGVGAPGIDVLVTALAANPNLQIDVVAPLTNQSGTGSNYSTTPLAVSSTTTASGHPATAVAGFPSDSVLYGVLQGLAQRPDLVVSGINSGQNIADLATLSGTVGAALTAARMGIPAIAGSQGLVASSYTDQAQYIANLVEQFRTKGGVRKRFFKNTRAGQALVLNLNFPTCIAGVRRGLKVVPLGRLQTVTGYTNTGPGMWQATVEGLNPFASDCTSTVLDPATDIEAMNAGFASATPLSVDLTVNRSIRLFRFLER